MEEVEVKTLKHFLILRRAQVMLSPYISELEVRFDEKEWYLEGVCYWRRWKYVLRFNCDKRLHKLTKELLRLEPAMIGKRIDVEDVKVLIIGLYAPASKIVPPLRMQLKKHAGLLKDKSLRNRVISAKILSGKRRRVETKRAR